MSTKTYHKNNNLNNSQTGGHQLEMLGHHEFVWRNWGCIYIPWCTQDWSKGAMNKQLEEPDA